MADWKSVIQNFFDNSDADNSFARVSPAGCPKTAISKCETQTGLILPDELRKFYQHSNGMGLEENESDDPRFIPKIESLPEYIDQCRAAFNETHSDYAERYVPFVDWENGDSSGYIYNSDGTLFECIVMFSHEHYEYDEKQDINEFLIPFAESLEELLSRTENGG